ncbi:sensor domain-containing diguanylate cyclase [soil metagenome]
MSDNAFGQTVALIDSGIFSEMVQQGCFSLAIRDRPGRYVYTNPAFDLQFGVMAQQVIGNMVSEWAALEEELASLSGEPPSDHVKPPIRHKVSLKDSSGHPKFWQVVMFGFTDPGGEDLIGILAQDITVQENLAVELDVVKLEAGMIRIYEQALDGVAMGNWEGILTYANQPFCGYFGSAPAEMVGRSWKDLPKPEDFGSLRAAMRRMWTTGKSETEAKFVLPTGEIRWTWLRFIRDGEGSKPGFHIFLRDITTQRDFEDTLDKNLRLLQDARMELVKRQEELEAANARLRIQASTDGLTGLLNHREFHSQLSAQIDLAERYQTPFSLLMLDIDFFKKFNDRHGHPAGDELLRHFARILSEAARTTDVVCRYGGEEFVIILPNTGLDGALEFAERLRASIETQLMSQGGVTSSLGISVWSPGQSGQAILEAADMALYQSKSSGRNRVSVAPAAPSGA